MTSGKGKGRATDADEVSNPHGQRDVSEPGNTMLDRVAASAVGLARSTFTAPNANELHDGVLAAQAGSGKPQQSSSTGNSAWIEGARPTQQTDPSVSQRQPFASFRESHKDAHVANAEAEFSTFLDGIPSFEPSVDMQLQHDQALDIPSFHTSKSTGLSQLAGQTSGYTTVQEQQDHDGDEVLALLSDPNSEGIESIDVYKALDDDPVIWRLTATQRAEWEKRLETDFPEAAPHDNQHPYTPFNLVPPFETDLSLSAFDQDSFLHFGKEISTEQAREEWINQWDAVLYRYTDEVWGDLMPLVEEAREEVQAIKDTTKGSATEPPKALRRLGLVLGHLRR